MTNSAVKSSGEAAPKIGIVFVGNCQAAALAWTYNRYISAEPATNVEFFDGRDLSAAAHLAINNATTLVVQVADLNHESVRQIDNARARIVRFPYVSGNFIWPFASEGHVRGRDLPLSEFGAFSDEMGGDKFLNARFVEGSDAERALDAYMALDIESAGRLGHRYDLSQRMQKARDDRSDIDISSYIETTLSRERLFATRGHPFSGLFVHLASQVFEKLGAPSESLAEMKRGLQPGPLEHECVPIHPGVARYFGLVPLREDGTFIFNMVIQTFGDYILRYMRQDCNPHLLRGRRLSESGQHALAVESLSRGLALSPRSPDAERLLSNALHHLERREEALCAAERSVRIDPTNIQSLLHLAQFYLVLGKIDDATITLERLLALNPNQSDGRRMISAARDMQAKSRQTQVC